MELMVFRSLRICRLKGLGYGFLTVANEEVFGKCGLNLGWKKQAQ